MFYYYARPVSQKAIPYQLADNADDWNRAYVPAYRALRELEPQRAVILGCNQWSNVTEMEKLAVPENDPFLILTFHYYNSMLVSHYRAPFVLLCKEYGGPVRYPGVPVPAEEWAKLPSVVQAEFAGWNKHYDADTIRQEFQGPLRVGGRTGLPLYCGEFGISCHVPAAMRKAWDRDVRTVCEENGIGWAAWNFKKRVDGMFFVFGADREPTPVSEGLLA